MNKLEVHHIFPKAQLYKHRLKFQRPEVNALGNFCFLTKDTNLNISDRFPKNISLRLKVTTLEVLASQWIPQDPELWKMENYREFRSKKITSRRRDQQTNVRTVAWRINLA